MFAPTFLNQKLGRKFLLLSAFRPYCYLNWLFNMSPATSWFRDSFFFRLLVSTSISSRWCRLPSLRIPSSAPRLVFPSRWARDRGRVSDIVVPIFSQALASLLDQALQPYSLFAFRSSPRLEKSLPTD